MLLMQAGNYLRAMNWHNKFASYLGLQGSDSDDLGLQGGSNINAVWSSELAARCSYLFWRLCWLMKLFFNSETQLGHMAMGGCMQFFYKLTIRQKCINAILQQEGIQAVHLSNWDAFEDFVRMSPRERIQEQPCSIVWCPVILLS